MFFLLALILFRVNNPEEIQGLKNKKRFLEYQKCLKQANKNSENKQDLISQCRHLKEENDELDDYDGIIFENTNYSSSNTKPNEYTIYGVNTNFLVIKCNFNECSFSKKMIYADNHGYIFNMTSNIITNCYNKQQTISDTTSLVYSKATFNNIHNNAITFKSIENSCRAYQIEKSYNLIFNDNQIINANVGSDPQNLASGLLIEGIDNPTSGDPIEISNCLFSSCFGGNGSTLIIKNFDYHLQIKSTTFEKSKNNEIRNTDKDEPNGYHIIIMPTVGSQNHKLSFHDCVFNLLESNSLSGGSIGLWYKEESSEMNLVFENTIFKNLYFSSTETIGGAILINHAASNKNTKLTVTDCSFKNITSAGNGAAIHFYSILPLKVERTNFTDIYSPGLEINTGIYVFFGDDDLTVSFTDCKFYNDEFQREHYLNNSVTLDYLKSMSFNHNSSFIGCSFTNNVGYTILSKNINIFDFINCDVSNSNGGLELGSIEYSKIINSQFRNIEKNPVFIFQDSNWGIEYENLFINNCIFDKCNGGDYILFNVEIYSTFSFKNNVISGIAITESTKYIAAIKHDIFDFENFVMDNITFQDNKCNSLYGGGSGILFSGSIKKVTFSNCKFLNNFAMQDKTNSRPSSDSNQYYNGDGGAFQIGYGEEYRNFDVTFEECTFERNQAFRHGGALAIQTLGAVEIKNCNFKDNTANVNSNPQLMFEDHFSKKTQGRGGAIYINPYYSEGGTDSMSRITIDTCTFTTNKAYDGFAIYIEGDGTVKPTVDIKGNTFRNNYNANHLTPSCAIISSEIEEILDGVLTASPGNTFENDDDQVKEIMYVDHYGNIIEEKLSSSEEETTPEKPIESSSEVVTTPEKPVEPSSEVVTTPEKPVESSSEVVTTPEKPIEPSSEVVTTPEKPIEPSSEVVTTPEKPIESSSEEITETQTLLPPVIDDIINDQNCADGGKHCEKIVDDNDNEVLNVFIDKTMFDSFNKNDNYGGAIYLYNCGIICNITTFISCSAIRGGGAIYIMNQKSNKEYVVGIQNIKFKSCQASFGGAVYIYVKEKSIAVRLTNCEFEKNTIVPASEENLENDKEIIGGSSIFLTARNGKVIDCIFNDEESDYSSVRLYNNFNDNSRPNSPTSPSSSLLLKGDYESEVIISNCKFEFGKNSKNTISYVRGFNGVPLIVENCMFNGLLSKDSHYIIEKVISKESPKLVIKNCKFSDDSKNALLLDNLNDLEKIKLENKFNYTPVKSNNNKNKNIHTLKIVISLLIPTLALITILVIIFTILKKKDNETDPLDVLEGSDNE